MENHPDTNPEPANPTKEVQPSAPEIDPGKTGNDTEVDLDRSKTQTYPDQTPPERH